jgi:hypothetical protein
MKKELGMNKKVVIVIDGRQKMAYSRLLSAIPPEVEVISILSDPTSFPQKKSYMHSKLFSKIKNLIANISQLPIKPQAIYGFGSFFRANEFVGDLDISIEGLEHDPVWKATASFFENHHENLWVQTFYHEMHALYNKFKLENNNKRIISVKQCANTPEFLNIISKYNLNPKLMPFFSWEEIIGFDRNGYHKWPNPKEVFKRMWLGNVKGISVPPLFNKDENIFILLWSPECPDFQINYDNWYHHERNAYIQKEFYHIIKDTYTHGEIYSRESSQSMLSSDEDINQALKALSHQIAAKFGFLYDKFKDFDPSKKLFEETSQVINELRSRAKALHSEYELTKDQILTRKTLALYDKFWAKK